MPKAKKHYRSARGEGIVIFPVTERGYGVALKLIPFFEGARAHAPQGLRRGGLARKVKDAFGRGSGLVFIGAAGIAVRMIAPHIKGKDVDPAVVVVDDGARFAISLLSGHLGGANALAKEIARAIGAVAVVTTATDTAGLPCAEDIAHRFHLAIENPGKIKAVNSAILRGGPVTVYDEDPKRLAAVKKAFSGAGVFRFERAGKDMAAAGACVVISSAARTGYKGALVLRPREFVVGVGCIKGVSEAEVEKACKGVFSRGALSLLSIRNLATIDIKRREKGITGYAEKIGAGVVFYGKEELLGVHPPSGPSSAVFESTGAFGVSEPAALLSSGAKRLWIKKVKAGMVTIAVAKAPFIS